MSDPTFRCHCARARTTYTCPYRTPARPSWPTYRCTKSITKNGRGRACKALVPHIDGARACPRASGSPTAGTRPPWSGRWTRRRRPPAGFGCREGSSPSRPRAADVDHEASCSSCTGAEQRGEVVYRLSVPAQPSEKVHLPRAARQNAVRGGLRKGVVSHSILGRLTSGKKSVLGSRPRPTRRAKPSSHRSKPSWRTGVPK